MFAYVVGYPRGENFWTGTIKRFKVKKRHPYCVGSVLIVKIRIVMRIRIIEWHSRLMSVEHVKDY